MDYDVIQASTLEQLVQNVRTAMDDGFEPIGGIQFVQYYGTYIFMQSIKKVKLFSVSEWYAKREKEQNS